jgi:large subunit ribosomal protein L6
MSRVGKNPIKIPSGTQVHVNSNEVVAKGKLGEEKLQLSKQVKISQEGDLITVIPVDESKESRTHWGTYRSLINNLVQGVSEGFTINLEINGVGFRAAVQGNILVLQLGFSHEVNFDIPQGVTIKCEKQTLLSIQGTNKQLVGHVASKIRALRPPEPYKGKGIKYADEFIVRKEGKKK